MELDTERMIPDTHEDGAQEDVSAVIVSPVGYRSITCQTDEFIPDTISDNCTYFLCNLDHRDGVSTAAVQVNISVKKTADKSIETSVPLNSMPSIKQNV